MSVTMDIQLLIQVGELEFACGQEFGMGLLQIVNEVRKQKKLVEKCASKIQCLPICFVSKYFIIDK